MKIFLSHSSSDKDIVGRVYDEIGHVLCHYDIATFNPTGFLPEQIHAALSESTHFVLFASETALASPWVRGELRVAFLNWMRAGVHDVMVFLLRDGKRSAVPEWLQSYVILEHPTPTHIALRVKSKVAEFERKMGAIPPFYRWDDLSRLEKEILAPTERMPKAIVICAPDGYGRKQLVNELYLRHFSNVAAQKLSLTLEECTSEVDLFKSVLGALSLVSISDLSKRISNFESRSEHERQEELAQEISELCSGGQALFLDAHDELLNENGEIVGWIAHLVHSLPRADYPRVILFSYRRPTFVSAELLNILTLIHLEPLPDDRSKLLLMWWMNKLGVSLEPALTDQVLEYVSGSNKQIELAALLFKANPDYFRVKSRIFKDLERQAGELLRTFENNESSRLVLAFVADCGLVSESDLLFALEGVGGITRDQIQEAVGLLVAYGFLLSDTVSLRLPTFLGRAARNLGKEVKIAGQISLAWARFVSLFEVLSDHAESSISLLTDAAMARLRSGINELPLVESIILPSQCYKVARRYYDQGKYGKAFELCQKAYARRLALTEEGAIEVLRIQGLSAARSHKGREFDDVIQSFKQHGSQRKAHRIQQFLLGFDRRLEGQFDDALKYMMEAYKAGGAGDFHILRELAFLYWSQGDMTEARNYIQKAKARASSNPFVLEMEIRIELAQGEGHIMANQQKILSLIDDLAEAEQVGSGSFAYHARIEYQVAIKREDDALNMIKVSPDEASLAIQIIKARILLNKKRFGEARELLVKLKGQIEKGVGSQRKSALPAVVMLLVDAGTGVSLSDGIEEYGRNSMKMPKKVRDKLRGNLRDAAIFSRASLTGKEKKLLDM